MSYVDVILPLPVGQTYTYAVPHEMEDHVGVGHRVIVPFGSDKLYTGVVVRMHDDKPQGDFEIRTVVDVLDSSPVVDAHQLRLWQWISLYYMCSLGDVMKAALPSGMKLASETSIRVAEDYEDWDKLTRQEVRVIDLLHDGKRQTVAQLQKEMAPTALMRTVKSLLAKGAVEVTESLVRSFRPKRETHVRLHPRYLNEAALSDLLESLQPMPRRYALVVKLMEMAAVITAIKLNNPKMVAEVSRAELLRQSGVSAAVLTGLRAKGVVDVYDYEVGRLKSHQGSVVEQLPLTPAQQEAYDAIKDSLRQHDACLLHGVTSSGKTEIYIRLIKEALARGKQVLYMLPEIALTTQITHRLRRVFGDTMGVYHSRFPDAERVETWQKQTGSKPFMLILGVRSSLFLPYRNLGLVIVDEEHETSYKQQDPAPRYHGRDAALMLARLHGAKVVLGSATPSVETYHHAATGKYGYVRLDKRYGDMMLPHIEVVDVADLVRRKMMKPPFSPLLLGEMDKALANGEQVILFQNRRGYAPRVECNTCGWGPTCQYCDVSLTYHQEDNRLHCHYCGNVFAVPEKCPNCEGQELRTHGFGTEKIEEEVRARFPQARIARLDLDTTRTRNSYERILGDFAEGRTDILIGTQMVSKGLDFDRVHVVGILDADTMLSRPDFRAHERAFQMICQVAGRAGRRAKQGMVVLQTRRAAHPIIQQVVDSDYESMYRDELFERQHFYYPPFFRLIYVVFKHRDEQVVSAAATYATNAMLQAFGGGVLGPDKPVVSKIHMLYIRRSALKVSPSLPVAQVRQRLHAIVAQLKTDARFRSVTVYFDVDPG